MSLNKTLLLTFLSRPLQQPRPATHLPRLWVMAAAPQEVALPEGESHLSNCLRRFCQASRQATPQYPQGPETKDQATYGWWYRWESISVSGHGGCIWLGLRHGHCFRRHLMTSVMQCNTRGVQANREELQLLISNFNLAVICLQETLLRDNNSVGFRDYSVYHCPGVKNNDMFCGDVALLIKNIFAHKCIELNIPLQAVAARITCFKSITVCSVYLPPTSKWTKNDLQEDLINQVPPPIVLLGDFNAHSNEWGCSKNDSKGKMISDLMVQRNLSATYL